MQSIFDCYLALVLGTFAWLDVWILTGSLWRGIFPAALSVYLSYRLLTRPAPRGAEGEG